MDSMRKKRNYVAVDISCGEENDDNQSPIYSTSGDQTSPLSPSSSCNCCCSSSSSFQTHLGMAVFISSAGNVLEWFDFAIFGYFADVFGELFFPGGNEVATMAKTFAVFAGAFVMRPIGGALFGHISDTYGRKQSMLLSIFLMALSSVATGCLPTYKQVGVLAPCLLVLVRCLQGLSVGGQLVGSMVYTIESAEVLSTGYNALASTTVTYPNLPRASGESQCRDSTGDRSTESVNHLTPHTVRPSPVSYKCMVGAICLASANLGGAMGSGAAALLHAVFSPQFMLTWGWRIPFWSGVLVGVLGHCFKDNLKEISVSSTTVNTPTTTCVTTATTTVNHDNSRDRSGVGIDANDDRCAMRCDEHEHDYRDSTSVIIRGGNDSGNGRADGGAVSGTPLEKALRNCKLQILLIAAVCSLWATIFYVTMVWVASMQHSLIEPPLRQSFIINTVMMLVSIVMFPLVGHLADRFGMMGMILLGGVSAIVASPVALYQLDGTASGMISCQCILLVPLCLFGAVFPTWMVYSCSDSSCRASVIGIAYNLSQAVLGGTAPLIATGVYGVAGRVGVGWYISGVATMAMLALCIKGWTASSAAASGRAGPVIHTPTTTNGNAARNPIHYERDDGGNNIVSNFTAAISAHHSQQCHTQQQTNQRTTVVKTAAVYISAGVGRETSCSGDDEGNSRPRSADDDEDMDFTSKREVLEIGNASIATSTIISRSSAA